MKKTQVRVLVLKLAWCSPALGSRRTLPKIRDILFVAPTDQYSQPAVVMLLTSMKSISLNCPKSQMGNAASSANIYWPDHRYPTELCNSGVMKSPCVLPVRSLLHTMMQSKQDIIAICLK